jgi:hypothetical protein
VSKTLAGYWRRYRTLPPLQRELVTLGLMLLFALTVLPLEIFLAGQYYLGDYIRDPSGTPTGGFGALWVDYLKGIFRGSFGYWVVLLGPWLLLLAGRGLVSLARRERAGRVHRQTP